VHEPSIVIVTPALADANNGNWQTARRWADLLAEAYRVRLTLRWEAAPDAGDDDLMIALHARRSAPSIAAWREARPHRPLLLVLTGTDLYRDIEADAEACRSLALADALVVLNELGARRLPPAVRHKCRVVLQSCAAAPSGACEVRRCATAFTVLMVGHLREEKDPQTFLRAAARLAGRCDLRFVHVGAALEAALGQDAATLAARQDTYRWLGPLPHDATLQRIREADVLVHASRMEGGAHVVVEAVRSGTPVLASRIDGNVGLLGEDYGGYFPVGDHRALADMIERAHDDPAILPALRRQVIARAPRFAPQAEAAALHDIVAGLLARQPDGARA
jgi:putative glycosyltransferase (TIGR04348 family)